MSEKFDIDHISRLARLKLSEAEKKAFSEQLKKILEFVEKLNELNTENVEPLYNVLDMQNVFREDTPKEGLKTEEALKNAPKRKGNFFRVPRVI